MDLSKLSAYDYELPEELIAQEPLAKRDRSRMLVLKRQGSEIDHRLFFDLPAFLREGDLLVLNDTRVIPARLLGKICGSEKNAELLLLRPLKSGRWEAMVRPGRNLKPGVRVAFEGGVEALINSIGADGLRTVSFNYGSEPFEELLRQIGRVPLPPYIKKEIGDPDRYQTIYALNNGSAAAPTAGFHFTEKVFTTLAEKGVKKAFLTLHIGPGTFQPVKTENILEHRMHREFYELSEEAAAALNETRQRRGRIIAVGTTVCRVLESIAPPERKSLFEARRGWTGLFIYPGFRFKAIDALVTNFHLPRSTLVMLVSAFAGRDLTLAAYKEAVRERYRFFSFGDSMLIL